MAELMSTLRVNENDYTIKDAAAWSRIDDLYAIKESLANKVTGIDQDSTDTEYPSAKCVYDAIQANSGLFVEITYGTTTSAAIDAILAAGKYPYLYNGSRLYIYASTTAYYHMFTAFTEVGSVIWYGINVLRSSSAYSQVIISQSNSIDGGSTNSQIASAKAVYDFVSGGYQKKLYKHDIDFSRATGSTVDMFFITMFLTESNNDLIDTPAKLLDTMANEYGANVNLPASGYFFNTNGETVQVLHMSANPYAYSGIGAFNAHGINTSTGLYEGREFINAGTDIAVTDTVTGV